MDAKEQDYLIRVVKVLLKLMPPDQREKRLAEIQLKGLSIEERLAGLSTKELHVVLAEAQRRLQNCEESQPQ